MRLGGICHYPNLYRMTMRTKENRLLQKHVMDHWWWSTTTARKWEHLAVGIRCKTPVWLCTLPLRLKVFKVEFQSVIVRARVLGDQTNTDAWASLGIAHCPRSPSLPRPRGFAQRHCQFFDWTISSGSLDLPMHHYCKSSSQYCHLKTPLSYT